MGDKKRATEVRRPNCFLIIGIYSNITGLYHVVYTILNDIMAAFFFTKVRKPGGWDKCVGPFGNSDADEYGISVKACQNTCYARLEKSGSK